MFNLLSWLLNNKKQNKEIVPVRRRSKRGQTQRVVYSILKDDLFGAGTLNEIIKAYKKRTGKTIKRNYCVVVLFHLTEKGKIYTMSGKKGVYATKKRLLKLLQENIKRKGGK